ncbi:MAG: type VI secretion system-associated FHA domain protein TagH, partial [Roseibium sp.]
MSVRLVIEHAPHSQRQMECTFEGGELTIGRSNDSDWQIDDPDQFVSRKHCVISENDGTYKVTDASRGGVFIDGANEPLGAGNSVSLEHGMRMRIGDIVLRAEMQQAEPIAPQEDAATFDFAFQAGSQQQVKPEERPDTLPDPFGLAPSKLAEKPPSSEPKISRPLDQTDPFALDLKRSDKSPDSAPPSDFGGGFFDRPEPKPDPDTEPESTAPQQEKAAPNPAVTAPAVSQPDDVAAATQATQSQLRDAFLRGAGLDPDQLRTQNPLGEMEELGKRFNALVEGMMHLLRSRAQEKQNIRVAQTIIGNADVNPLKFMATTQ